MVAADGRYSVFSTHFGMFDWKGWDKAIAANPQLPRTGISPTTVYAQMMDDAWLADGVFIWWDLIGLSDDINAQRGIFSSQSGRHAVIQCPPAATDDQSWGYLQLSSVEGVGLLRGWFQSLSTTGEGVPAGNVSVSMLQGYKDILTTGFRTVIEVKQTHASGDWEAVYTRGSNDSCADAVLCNTSAVSSHLEASAECFVTSCSDNEVNVTLALSTTMLLRTRLEVVRDAGGNFGVCVKAATSGGGGGSGDGGGPPGTSAGAEVVKWAFYSGIDPSLSSVVQEQQAIVNATRTIQQCSCNDDSQYRNGESFAENVQRTSVP